MASSTNNNYLQHHHFCIIWQWYSIWIIVQYPMYNNHNLLISLWILPLIHRLTGIRAAGAHMSTHITYNWELNVHWTIQAIIQCSEDYRKKNIDLNCSSSVTCLDYRKFSWGDRVLIQQVKPLPEATAFKLSASFSHSCPILVWFSDNVPEKATEHVTLKWIPESCLWPGLVLSIVGFCEVPKRRSISLSWPLCLSFSSSLSLALPLN